ncbi:MAG TPA: hypothetical protein VHX38_17525 [Pseudonocardiaceae bacterium]|jgi:hypothetical protein|nr:hypothetical protein [Pseudonocardiaceae bacterium]
MSAPTTDVLRQVRQALDSAHEAGEPAPGRPTLVRQLGATDHQVRKALEILATEQAPAPTLALVAGTPTGNADNELADSGEALAITAASAGEAADFGSPGDHQGSPTTVLPARAGHVTDDLVAGTGGPGNRPGEAAPPVVRQPSPVPASPRQLGDPAGGRLVAWAGFIFGSLTSVAANVLAARISPAHAAVGWHPSMQAEVGAAVWPVALLLSVEALSRIRWPKSALWNLARFGGAGTVALGSALISYSHIAAVLAFWGYSALGAHVGPLVIDGLMSISGFALLATAGGRAGGAGELGSPAVTSDHERGGDRR